MSNPNKQLLEHILADIESDENLLEYIQPDIDSHRDLIPYVEVDMGSTINDQPRCLLSHFNYGFDERGMRLYQILEQFLNDIYIYLLDRLSIPTLVPNLSTNTILDVIFIYDQLLSKTIIVKSVAKNVSDQVEEDIASKLGRDIESDAEKEDIEKEDTGDVLYSINIAVT
ncbi:unnamed protein product [Rotaria sordida]|uniref:Uncharacterized protein n=1 Tax=Rotaria sordida TaxID=392033 RepID=A0A815T9A3_9BILA|nr:unnamed protein product [Rotaria sordida]CAF4075093.1 unnamed protein product [Rotaria sordida]